MPRIEAVVFDLDDTLYSERQYALGGFGAVARAFADRLGDPAVSLSRMSELLDTPNRPRVFDALLDELRITDRNDLLVRMIATYRAHAPSIALFEGVEQLLTELRARFRLGLLTDGRSEGQWAKIDALALRNRFDVIVVTADLGPGFGKPSPRPFELISARLQVASTHTAYVADNPAKDFIAPNALGWTTIQVRRSGGLYADQPPAPGGAPHLIIESVDRLRDWLRAT